MKVCIACREKFKGLSWQCPACLTTPDMQENFMSFSPAFTQNTSGFKPYYFSELAHLEENNFWFVARNQLIIWALKHYFSLATNFFEIGCGTGFVLSAIEKSFPHLTLFGSEILSAGLYFTQERIKAATLFQMDARCIPFENEFDVIGAFDVLEHIEEDTTVLSQIYNALRPQGGVILTVPQHDFLWSKHDERACHVRRYNASDLKNKVTKAGFKLVKTTSFVTLLLPFMLASRLTSRLFPNENASLAEFKLPHFINISFEKILFLENMLIRFGIHLPMGGSLLLIAQKT